MLYGAVRILFRIIALPLFRFRVRGADRVPRSGGAIVVAAHRSWLDPACVGGACPRPVHFLILDNVYRVPWFRWFYRAMGTLPVRPGSGAGSVASLRGAVRLLRQGRIVGVFPEGRVHPADRPGEVLPGAAMLALRADAPVIPMVIDGSARAWPHGRAWPGPARVSVHIGSPIRPGGHHGREALAGLIERIKSDLQFQSPGDA